jgi:hypothetical protein
MSDNQQRLRYLTIYQGHLSNELDQMQYGQNQVVKQARISAARERSAGMWAFAISLLAVVGISASQLF